MNADVKKVLAVLEANGFEVERVKNGHFKITDPTTGRSLQIAATPGDSRSLNNSITRIKHKFGFDLRKGSTK